MARPEKNTVDYIPLDCQFSDSMQAVEALYGNDGFVVWVKILQKLGRTENYIIDVRDDLHWSLFYPIFRIPEKRLLDILNLLASLNCINKELWERRIIYSTNLIKRISRVYKKRAYELKNINTILEEMGVLGTENLVLGTENLVLGTGYTQSKVKESKVKESKVKESKDNINSSSSSLEENFLTEEEEELLKNHSLKNKVKYFKPWLRKVLANGDYKEILEKEKKRLQAKEEKKKQEEQKKVEEVITPEDEKEIEQIQKRIRENFKKRRTN